jgi:hypothetical protein
VAKTPLRAIRIDDQLWLAAQIKADQEDSNVSEVIRAQLETWIDQGGKSDDIV